jgi:hypothetical protein
MIADKIASLIMALKDQTESGTITWDTTNRTTEYIVQFNSGSITTDAWHHEEANRDYADFIIYNANGEKIETLQFSKQSDNADYTILSELYKTIQRKLLKVDETIESIFNELKDKEIPF